MASRYFLFCFLFITSCLVAGKSPEYALKGGKVSLKPGIAGHPDAILWKYNGNKVVEFNSNEQDVYNPFKNRIDLDWVSADLDISDLRFEDSGDYELDVSINRRLHRSFYKLEVIDKVAMPTITCETTDGGSSNTSGKLLCSAEPRRPQSLMKFEWRTRGNVQPGRQLQIALGDTHDDEVYSCSVSNLLSNETATFTAKDCYPAELCTVPVVAGTEDETQWRLVEHVLGKSSSALLIAIPVIAAVMLLVGLAVLYCKLRHKESDKEKAQDDERKPLFSPVHRASTLPSTQRLVQSAQEPEMNKQDERPPGGVQAAVAAIEQRGLNGESKNTGFSPRRSGFPPPLDLSNLACDGQGDVEQHREPSEEEDPQSDPSHSEKDNEPEPAGVSDDFSEDTRTNQKFPISLEHPEPEKEEEEDEEGQSAPADAEPSPAAQPHSPLTESSPNIAPEDTAGEQEEVANSDQVPGESAEKNVSESDSSEEREINESDDCRDGKLLSTEPASDQREDTGSDCETVKEPEMNKQNQMPKPGHVQRVKERLGRNEPEKEEEEDEEDHSAPGDAEPSPAAQPHSPLTESSPDIAPEDTAGEQEEVANSDQGPGESAEKNAKNVIKSSGEGEIRESDDQQETDKPVSEEDDESKTDSVGDHEETATSQQPRSPTPTKPDNRNTDARQESPDTAHAHPDEEEEEEEEEHKTGTDSDETEGQSDKGEGETVQDKIEVPCGLKGEEQGNESCSGDSAGQKKDGGVA